jgi:hypothetical protein
MNVDPRLCSAIAEAVVEGATEQLLLLQNGSTPRNRHFDIGISTRVLSISIFGPEGRPEARRFNLR